MTLNKVYLVLFYLNEKCMIWIILWIHKGPSVPQPQKQAVRPSVRLSVCLSVCLSVTPFWHCFSSLFIVKFSGHRSKFKVTEFEINCAFLAFLDVNSSLNLSKLSNDAQCLEGHRRGALSFWKVIYNFKVTLAKNCHFAIKSLRKIIMLWSLTIFVRNEEADGSWWSWPLLVLGYIGDRSERMSWWDICFDHESCQGSVHMMNGIQPGKLWKTKLPDLLSNGGNLFHRLCFLFWKHSHNVHPCFDSSCMIPYPDSKIHGANMGPIWGWQDPGGPMLAPWTLLSG